MSAPRWMSIDDYLAAAGESWATVGNICPGTDHYRAPRSRPVDDDQDQESAGTPARTTSTRSSKATPAPRP